jgi:hypothetical protein
LTAGRVAAATIGNRDLDSDDQAAGRFEMPRSEMG